MCTFLNGGIILSAWPQCSTACVVTQKDATVIILHGPLGISSQSFATDVQKKSAGKDLRELLLRVCPRPNQSLSTIIIVLFDLGQQGGFLLIASFHFSDY